MMLDKLFEFGLPAITTDTTRTVCTNVVDVGSAKKVFGGAYRLPNIYWKTVITAGTGTLSILLEFLACSSENLTTNPAEALGSSGVVETHHDGTAIAINDTVSGFFGITPQKTAFQYYGGFVTLGGTAPSCDAGDFEVVDTPQSNGMEA